eukprot:627889-Pyramimonas_sp.AAC.3
MRLARGPAVHPTKGKEHKRASNARAHRRTRALLAHRPRYCDAPSFRVHDSELLAARISCASESTARLDGVDRITKNSGACYLGGTYALGRQPIKEL